MFYQIERRINVNKRVKFSHSNIESFKTGDLRINHIEMVCEEYGKTLKVRIEDDIAWLYYENSDHLPYGEYLLEPLDPQKDENWF